MQYAFILGHNPKLSAAEILAVLPKAKVASQSSSFLILENNEINCEELMNRLGGSIKIAKVISEKIDKKLIVEELKSIKASNKLNFGLSYYECKPDKLGMDIKNVLKKIGISSRLVVGRDKALSSVIIQKNKVHEFLIIAGKYLAHTCAIQDFESYSKRDYGRPARDLKSGSMPPKLAQIMINLAQVDKSAKIHDPFCGSGTILQEAALLGYTNISGSDSSAKAVEDTKKNLDWLVKNYKLQTTNYKLSKIDVRNLNQYVSGIDAIITEPYLGPLLKGRENKQQILKNIKELEGLYIQTFEQFSHALNKNGTVVIIFPTFRIDKQILELKIQGKIKELGFTQTSKDDLFYFREGQKVYRNVRVFTRQS